MRPSFESNTPKPRWNMPAWQSGIGEDRTGRFSHVVSMRFGISEPGRGALPIDRGSAVCEFQVLRMFAHGSSDSAERPSWVRTERSRPQTNRRPGFHIENV